MEETQAKSFLNYYSPCMQFTDEPNQQAGKQLQDIFFNLQPLTINDDKTLDNAGDSKRAFANELKTEAETKRTSKQDRHRKINTAHGLRDRRMRLSIDVARKFFDLQDLLGFDKASKTVEWLLMKSNSAIIEIKGRLRDNCSNNGIANCISSASEYSEVIPEMDESTENDQNQKPRNMKNTKMKSHFKKEKKDKVVRRVALHQLASESRKIARERAKRRTLEKRKFGEANVSIGKLDNGSWSHFGNGEKWSNEFRAQNQELLGTAANCFCFSQNNADISQETEPLGGFSVSR